MDTFFMAITWAGSLLILGPLSLLTAAVLLFQRCGREALLIFGSLCSTVVLTYLLKMVIARPRPPVEEMLISVPAGFSFPSAHTSQITAFSLAAALVFAGNLSGAWKYLLWSGIALFPLLVGISRAYLGVHYISDVLCGWLLGIFCVMLVKQMTTRRREK